MVEKGFEGTAQYFRERPNKFFVPIGGRRHVHKLCTDMFFGCWFKMLGLFFISIVEVGVVQFSSTPWFVRKLRFDGCL